MRLHAQITHVLEFLDHASRRAARIRPIESLSSKVPRVLLLQKGIPNWLKTDLDNLNYNFWLIDIVLKTVARSACLNIKRLSVECLIHEYRLSHDAKLDQKGQLGRSDECQKKDDCSFLAIDLTPLNPNITRCS